MLDYNPILDTDSYKASHYLQYPPDTKYLSSYIESRGGVYPATLFFGLQYFLLNYLSLPIFDGDIEEAEEFLHDHGLPFNRAGFKRIVDKHGGFFPVKIQAVPEGMLVPTSNVLVQMVNTDPELPWVTSYLETKLLRSVWYPTTVATTSFYCKRDLYYYWLKSSDSPIDNLDFKLHDFGARGVSSLESAGIGGASHLVNFKGSDTMSGIVVAQDYYDEPMAGFSIPAAEHSTITSWGGPQYEMAAFENILDKFGASPLVAVVSDSYDIWNAVDKMWPELDQRIRMEGTTVVVRPDSGDPIKTPVRVIQILMERFGYTTNSKGYKVLPDHIRVIQGDGIDRFSIRKILSRLDEFKLSIDNIAFGMGAGLLQKCDRDTCDFAMKVSAIDRGAGWRPVYKEPVDQAAKTSKKGRLMLYRGFGKRLFTSAENVQVPGVPVLRDVWDTGVLVGSDSLSTIRQRASEALLDG